MSGARPQLVVAGDVVVAAMPAGLETAGAVGIADGRVVSAGTRDDVLAAAPAGVRVEDHGPALVVPGLHDFHLHLVGMARLRREARLDDARDVTEIARRLRDAARAALAEGWVRGRGWHEHALHGELGLLRDAVDDLPALVYSHDSHSAWASPAALRAAGIAPGTDDPPGGRIERDTHGELTGVLRERATDLVERVAGRLGGSALEDALDDVVAELAALGVTGATDAGDSSTENGIGPYAALGDRASRLLAAAPRLDGRLRLTVNVPAEAIAQAADLELTTGMPIPETSTLAAGWAKAYLDGALGSRTAALFEAYSCGDATDRGLARLSLEEVDELLRNGRVHDMALAVHVIGDRAAATVLDAMERAPHPRAGAPPDRLEHLQLLRAADRARLAAIDVTASLQPAHCAADRAMVEECWAGREALAYPYRSLADAGVRLAFGSDAPIETHNPWVGIFAAVHRRFPGDGTADWQPQQALDAVAALAAYTSGPALAAARTDTGHLRPGARADLAVLNVDRANLLSAGEELAEARSVLTLVDGREVHRS